MSDVHGPDFDNQPDKLTLTLDALRSDVERTPLTDSMTVRRRGEQRTRRQAIGGAVAAVAAVVVAIGLHGSLGSTDRASERTPASEQPTVNTSEEKPVALAADPFLPAGSPLLTVGQVDFQRSPDGSADLSQERLRCMPDPVALGAAETKGALFYSEVEGTFSEHALRFTTVEEAVAAESALRAAFEACPKGDPNEVTSNDRGPMDVGLDGFHASRESVPTADAGIGYNETGVVRDRNVLVVLYYNGMGNPSEGENDSPASSWVWSAERLQAAVDAAVA